MYVGSLLLREISVYLLFTFLLLYLTSYKSINFTKYLAVTFFFDMLAYAAPCMVLANFRLAAELKFIVW